MAWQLRVLGDIPRLGVLRRPRVGLGDALACLPATSRGSGRWPCLPGGGLACRAAALPAVQRPRLLVGGQDYSAGWSVHGVRGGTVLFFFIASWGTVGLAKRGLV
jgi:hypothetical protein